MEANALVEMDENAIGKIVLGCALRVHKALGPGLLEKAYEDCLAHEIRKTGLTVASQPTMPLVYDGIRIGKGYKLDLLIAKRVVIEVKAVEGLARLHHSQLLSYLKIGGYRLGYLLNFNVPRMRDGIFRIANGL
ncbi:MAG TPA: GxxExxY protein [Caulobacteraceae bacterium]|jgi:GxxExxY protein|nr:GxxExxY protein [Caulobacteraceae bacterium]